MPVMCQDKMINWIKHGPCPLGAYNLEEEN